MNQLQQAADRLGHGVLVAATEGTAERHPPLKGRRPALAPQPAPALAEEVADQAEMVRLERLR